MIDSNPRCADRLSRSSLLAPGKLARRLTSHSRRALFLLACLAGPAFADPTAIISGSYFELRPTIEPGAVAELHFRNAPTNGQADERAERTLSLGNVSVVIVFDWDVSVIGEDAVTITTDADHFSHPEVLTVRESRDGIALIYPLNAVGM